LNPDGVTKVSSLLAFVFMYTLYILYSATPDRYYVGYTGSSAEERLKKHLSHHRGFSARATDWRIVFKQVFAEKKQATDREKEIKKWKNRVLIARLIN